MGISFCISLSTAQQNAYVHKKLYLMQKLLSHIFLNFTLFSTTFLIFFKSKFKSYSPLSPVQEKWQFFLVINKVANWRLTNVKCYSKNCSPRQNIWKNKRKSRVKLNRTRKIWYLLLHTFWLLFLQSLFFWKRDWALGYISTQIWVFLKLAT